MLADRIGISIGKGCLHRLAVSSTVASGLDHRTFRAGTVPPRPVLARRILVVFSRQEQVFLDVSSELKG
jgi:hypothetical protein